MLISKDLKARFQDQIKNFSNQKIICDLRPLNLKLHLKSQGLERLELRQFLLESIKSQPEYQGQQNLTDLLQVGKKPISPHWSISISHSKGLAGWVFSPKNPDQNLQIGLDIEKTDRVSQRLVSRISQPEELKNSPSPALLWTAKEASFKCFFQNQKPPTIKDCRIDWEQPAEPHHLKDENSQSATPRHLKDENSQSFIASYHGKKARGLSFFLESFTISYVENF